MENFINENLVNEDKQIFLLKNKIKIIKKELYYLFDKYLKGIRSEISSDITNAVYDLINLSFPSTSLNSKEIISFIEKEIEVLTSNIQPFLTIEQLSLLKFPDYESHFNNNYDLNNKINSKENSNSDINLNYQNKNLLPDNFSYGYYDLFYKNDNNQSVNLDNNILDLDLDFDDFLNYSDNNFENNIEEHLKTESKFMMDINSRNINNKSLSYQGYNSLIPEESLKIIEWIDSMHTAIDYQLRKFSSRINIGLFKNNKVDNFMEDELINYLLSNHFLLSNPKPFVVLFDFAKSQLNDFQMIIEGSNISKIYLLNINTTEIEFNHLNLSVIRNKISEIRSQLKVLVKKEKYWYGKKNISKYNSSLVKKISYLDN